MGDFAHFVGRAVIGVGISIAALCCATVASWASPLDPASDIALETNSVTNSFQTDVGNQMLSTGKAQRAILATDEISLRTKIIGEPGDDGSSQEFPVETIALDAEIAHDRAEVQYGHERDLGSRNPDRVKKTKAVLRLFARLLPSASIAVNDGKSGQSRAVSIWSNGNFERDFSLSEYTSQVFVDEILVPLADFLLAPEFDQNGDISNGVLGFDDLLVKITMDDALPGGTLSFMDMTWRGHGGFSLFSGASGFRYAYRDAQDSVRTMTLKEVILTMLYELVRAPFFYISIAGVVLILTFTSSKRS